MEWIANPEAWLALVTLAGLEIVLGIDNVIFISILTSRLPIAEQPRARKLGLGLAMLSRIALLGALNWVMQLESELFEVWDEGFSGRDLILMAGGLFLIAKSTTELHHRLEGDGDGQHAGRAAGLGAILVQIAVIDIVFSLDSVITAVGMAEDLAVMVIAVVASVVVMVLFVERVCAFVEAHPTFKVLALSFLFLIGTALVGEGLGAHIPKGYLYFAMGFSFAVELLNMKVRPASRPPVDLRGPELPDSDRSA